MILCPKCDGPDFVCCDFCRHYDFNADEQGRYTGNGWCRLHQQQKDPGSMCDDYHCSEADDEVAI